jgi:hypothetical protein
MRTDRASGEGQGSAFSIARWRGRHAAEAPPHARGRLLWLLSRVGWGILLVLSLFILVNEIIQVSQQHTDFCQDYTAAQRLTRGIPVYAPLHCWAGFQPSLLQFDAHPPFSVLLVWPLGLLPSTLAAVLWGLGLLIAYLLSGWLLLRALGWRSLRSLALFVLGSVFWQALTIDIGEQNFGQLLTFLLVGSWLLERRRHAGWAGILLGLAGLLKVWPAVLLVLALLQRQWRLAWSGAATLAGGTLVSLAVLGPGAYAAYLGSVRANEVYWMPKDANISLVGALTRLFAGYPAPSLPLPALIHGLNLQQVAPLAEGVAGFFALGVLFLLWRAWRSAPGEVTGALSLGMMVTVLLLCFPLTWFWEAIALILPGATTLLALRRVPRPPRWWFALVALSLVPVLIHWDWLPDLSGWLLRQQGTGLAGLGALAYDLPTLGLLLFAAAQAWLLWRVCASQAPHAQRVSAIAQE